MRSRSFSLALAVAVMLDAVLAASACQPAPAPKAAFGLADPPAASTTSTTAEPTPSARPVDTGPAAVDAREPRDASGKDLAVTDVFLGSRHPSGGHPELIGVEQSSRVAWVRHSRVGTAVQIDLVDLVKGKIIDTWESDPDRKLELFGFKRLAFQPLAGTLAEDLVRYARIVAANEERRLGVPAMSVSADRTKIAFLVKAGPRLQVAVADGEGKNVQRLGTDTMRGEGPSVSPDGRWVTFSACEPKAKDNDCPRALWAVDLRDTKRVPRKLPVAWPGAVVWDADSSGLATTEAIALARASGVKDLRRSCLLHVALETGETKTVACADDAFDTRLAVSPDRKRAAFLVSRGEPPNRTFDVRTCDVPKGVCGEPTPIPQLVEDPLLTDDGVLHAAVIRGIPWSARLQPREETTFGEGGWMTGAHRLDGTTFARIVLLDKGFAIRTLTGTRFRKARP